MPAKTQGIKCRISLMCVYIAGKKGCNHNIVLQELLFFPVENCNVFFNFILVHFELFCCKDVSRYLEGCSMQQCDEYFAGYFFCHQCHIRMPKTLV